MLLDQCGSVGDIGQALTHAVVVKRHNVIAKRRHLLLRQTRLRLQLVQGRLCLRHVLHQLPDGKRRRCTGECAFQDVGSLYQTVGGIVRPVQCLRQSLRTGDSIPQCVAEVVCGIAQTAEVLPGESGIVADTTQRRSHPIGRRRYPGQHTVQVVHAALHALHVLDALRFKDNAGDIFPHHAFLSHV